MKAEKYIREKIPTMVGENHVSSMKLTTIVSLLNGYHKSELKLLNLDIVSNNEERVAASCTSCKWLRAKYDYKCYKCVNTSEYEQDDDC